MIKLDNISFDHCLKCTVCTIYCPVARASPLFPGPKQSGPDTERLRIKNPELVDESLKYCSNCKRCEIACPSQVKIADIIQSAKNKYLKSEYRLRDFFLSRTDLAGRLATLAGKPVNFFMGNKPVKTVISRTVGLPEDRPFPEYRQGRFHSRLAAQAATQEKFAEKAVYFHGCYVNYNDHDLGRDVVKVLNSLNVGVVVTPEKCCGVPLIANGYLEQAKKHAAYNIRSLGQASKKHSARIVSASSTCTFALKHEYPNLLEMDISPIAGKVDYITAFLVQKLEEASLPPLKPVNLTVAYHSPCHLERMGGVIHTIGLLKKIPGLKLKILHSECCGIAGTYGFKKEFHPIAQEVGAELFQRIKQAQPDIVVTDCETCKWQIEMNTPYQVVHPVSLLAKALY